MDIFEETAHAVVQGAIDMGNVRFLIFGQCRHISKLAHIHEGEFFLIFLAHGADITFGIVGGAGTIEGVDRFAVVLQADGIDIE